MTKNKINIVQKGYQNEVLLGKKLTAYFGGEFVRSQGSGARRYKNANVSHYGDIYQNDSELRFPFILETKHFDVTDEKYSFGKTFTKGHRAYIAFVKQSLADCHRHNSTSKDKKYPMVFFRVADFKGKAEWLVLVTKHFSDFYKNEATKNMPASTISSVSENCDYDVIAYRWSALIKNGLFNLAVQEYENY